VVSSLTQKLRRLYREEFGANAVKLGSTEGSRHTEGLYAVYDFALEGLRSGPDFVDHYAQLVVREGVNVAFLRRIARLSRSVEFPEKIVDDVFNVVVEWERWFRDES